jgi:hypothetical protein
MKKKYIFVLCPPYQGSTIITNLINNDQVSSFNNISKNFESQWVYEKHGCVEYVLNRWDPNYNMDMKCIDEVFKTYLDGDKNIYLEKSPPTICRAKIFEEHFSKLGDVYFIISIRNPYSTNYNATKWLIHAEQQRYNINNLKNVIVTSYEDCCLDIDLLMSKVLCMIPELKHINNGTKPKNTLKKYERHAKIHTDKVDRIIDKDEKNIILKNNVELLNYFGYKLIE